MPERIPIVAEHAHSHEHAPVHHEQHGPTVRTYVAIFVVLFVVTAIEVAASYLTDIGVPLWGEIAVLIALAVIKGALVVMFYMHLRFDSRWFTFLFTTGLILAVFGVVVFEILFRYRAGQVD